MADENELEALRREKQLLHKEIVRLEAELAAAQSQGGNALAINPNDEVLAAFRKMTTRQHAAIQGVIHTMTNVEIAKAMGASEVKVKVYLNSAAKRLGVKRRDAIIVKVWDTYRWLDPEEYQRVAGIPKDWIAGENPNPSDLGELYA